MPYTDLHQRILIEARVATSSPHISISSIGVPDQAEFVVLLEFSKAQFVEFQQCQIVLASKPEIKPKLAEEKDLSPAEILASLLNALGNTRGVSPVAVMVEILRSQKTASTERKSTKHCFSTGRCSGE